MHKQLSSPRLPFQQPTDLALFFPPLLATDPGMRSPIPFEMPICTVADDWFQTPSPEPASRVPAPAASSVPSSVAVDAPGQGLKRKGNPDREPPAKRARAAPPASRGPELKPTRPLKGFSAVHTRILMDLIERAGEEEKRLSGLLEIPPSSVRETESHTGKLKRGIYASQRAREEIERERAQIEKDREQLRKAQAEIMETRRKLTEANKQTYAANAQRQLAESFLSLDLLNLYFKAVRQAETTVVQPLPNGLE